MSFNLENKLQTKRPYREAIWEVDEIARFIPSISYDLEGASGRGGRWGNVGLDLEVTPLDWFSLEADATIDPHRNYGKPQSYSVDLSFHPGYKRKRLREELEAPPEKPKFLRLEEGLPPKPWYLGLGWRYQRNTSSQLSLETGFNLGKKWRLEIYQGLDVKRFITETTAQGDRIVKKIYDFPEFEYRLTRDFHEATLEIVWNVQRQQGESVMLLWRLKAFPEMPLEYEKNYHLPKAGRNFPKR